MIALRRKKRAESSHSVQSVIQVHRAVSPNSTDADDQPYEVKRNRPAAGDSFIGGLDVLTVHEQLSACTPDT